MQYPPLKSSPESASSRKREMGSSMVLCPGALLLLCALTLSLGGPTTTAALGFSCNSTATCRGLVGYKSPNTTTLAAVQSLFGVSDIRSILGANSLSESTPANTTVKQNQTVNIPFPCSCSNGSGTSGESSPVYTIRSGDGLYIIATKVFAGIVKFPDIQAFNNIPDANQIDAGQKLKIPLPCSCDRVAGEKVVHYGYVVPSGSSVEEIGQQYNVSADTLLSLNGLKSAKDLLADVAIDVPLKACSSSIRNDSIDSSLLVTNGTYVLTANGCVKCSCSSANNLTLQCQPSQLAPSNWSVCPSMQCQGTDLYIGNSTVSSCNRTTCDYAGYTNQTILTSLDTVSTCPVNYASKIGSGAFGWNIVATLLLMMLSLHHVQ